MNMKAIHFLVYIQKKSLLTNFCLLFLSAPFTPRLPAPTNKMVAMNFTGGQQNLMIIIFNRHSHFHSSSFDRMCNNFELLFIEKIS